MKAAQPSLDLEHIEHWIFDLDNTLYSGDVGFFAQIDKKMTSFMSRYLSLPPTEARIIQKQYLVKYGTTLSGLMAVHNMDPQEYLHYVHDIDLGQLAPDPRMLRALKTLTGRKYIFTNGSQAHAKNVGEHLGVYDLFDGVFGIEDIDYMPKPKRTSYDKFTQAFGIDPKKAIMIEDSVRNLEAPKAMGMTTLLITSNKDWSHEPKASRPHDGKDIPHFVDLHTHDLPRWLLAL